MSSLAFGAGKIQVVTMQSAATTTATGTAVEPWVGLKTFNARGTTSAGAGAATIRIEANNYNSAVATDWVLLCTITLTLSTTSAGDGCSTDSAWKYVRSRITAISGTDATVYTYVGAISP